jgi:hypothetical protein
MMRYLLGDVSDEERVRLEEYYFVDDDAFEQLSALEDELIDDYIRGELAEPQRKQFELHFLNSAERRQKLAFAESFNRYLSNAPTAVAAAKQKTWGQKTTDWLGIRGATTRWAFAGAFAAVLLAGASLVRENWRLHSQLRQMQAQQAELRQREEQLSTQVGQPKIPAIESTSGPEVAQSHSLPIVALTLGHGMLRSSADQKSLVIPPGPHLVRLQLDVGSPQPYENYIATLETAEGVRVWSKEGLKTMPETGGRTLALELPSSLLGNNDYILKLRGARSGAVQTDQYANQTRHLVVEEIAAYSFRVVKH